MTKTHQSPESKQAQLTAAEVGRYLKQLAALHRNARTGNLALSDALMKLSQDLMAAKSTPLSKVNIEYAHHQSAFNFSYAEVDNFTRERVRELLRNEKLSKSDLTKIGVVRFGMPKSRLVKLSRDEIVETITAAVDHEESLAIISDEAKRGGQLRSS